MSAANVLIGCALVLATASGVALIWWGRVMQRRDEDREQARQEAVTALAARRLEAGMPSAHWEVPGPPSAYETLWLGGEYDHFARQLSGIEADL